MFKFLYITQLSCKRTFHNYRASAIDIPWYILNSIYLDTCWIYLNTCWIYLNTYIQYTLILIEYTFILNMPWYIYSIYLDTYCMRRSIIRRRTPTHSHEVFAGNTHPYTLIHIECVPVGASTSFIHIPSYISKPIPWRIHMRDMTHTYVHYHSSMRVT